MMRYLSTLVVLVGMQAAVALAADGTDAQTERFEKKIRPLFAAKCQQCHSADQQKGGLSLETGAAMKKGGDSGEVIAPGSPDESLLIEAVRQTGDIKMPPKSKLTDEEIGDLIAWVKDGAHWPQQRVAIPLGNLFDDPAEASLGDALVSDEFKASAGPEDLGVERVLHGWGPVADVAPGLRIDLSPLGANGSQHGTVVNDAWSIEGGLRTKGERFPSNNDVVEQGIGLHANALVTFNLRVIRKAGELPETRDFRFISERAGLNDDVFGGDGPSAYLTVLVVSAKPDGTSEMTAYVNGRPQALSLQDGVYRLTGELPAPLKADGKYAAFDVPVPANAQYLVLAATGASTPQENTISSDHTVFSGARLEFATDGPGLLASNPAALKKFSITPEQRAFWAFQPIGNPAPPAVKDTAWPKTSIDNFVLSKLEEQGLAPSAPADKRALIRRATFDLTGLPPTPEEIEAFLADESAEAYAHVVDRLLASPRYGERWGRHWLDVARYGEDQAHTFAARMYPNGYLYRDWVVRSLNEDLPYDQFVIQQIAGDLLPNAEGQQQLAALGYFALGPVYYADAGCAAKAALDELDDRVDTLAAGFLGLTVACARCHDHKFDPISQDDYYALAGIFQSSSYREAPLVPKSVVEEYDAGQARIKEGEKKLNEHLEAESKRLASVLSRDSAKYLVGVWRLAHPPAEKAPSRGELAKQLGLNEFLLERWQKWLTAANQDKAPGVKEWLALSERKDLPAAEEGKTAPNEVLAAAEAVQVALAETFAERDRIEQEYQTAFSAASEEEKKKIQKPKLDKVKEDLIGAVSKGEGPLAVPRDRVESLLDEAAKPQLAAIKTELEATKKAAPARYAFAHALTEGKSADMKLHVRGSPTKTGPEVPRRFVEVLTNGEPQHFSTGSGRLDLAKSIGSADNPLTARVIVNRIWQHHFGRGLVNTPSNFGQLGERPSHPQLLDYLARRLIGQGWSLKAIHREILLSATYRQSSAFDGAKFERDPDNVWLWRMNRQRLDAEAWRDSLLATSGGMNADIGGPSGNLGDPNFTRRTLYGKVSRHDLNSMLRLFDFPDPNISNARRTLTTVPLQQLFVLNSEFMVRRAKELATRLAKEKPEDEAGRVQRAYSLLYGRPATEQEVQWGLEFVHTPDDPMAKSQLNRWEQYAQVLLASNEFAYVD
jgi:cytochrome c553